MAAVAAITAIVGTGISAYGQVKAGKAANTVGQINAGNIDRVSEINAALVEQGTQSNSDIAEFNARMAEAQARDAIRRGAVVEGRFRQQVRGMVGSQKVGFAAQGVDAFSGSALDVQTDTAYLGELDALQIRTDAAREAWGYRVDAENSRMQAEAVRKAGKLQAQSVRETARAEALSSRLGGSYAASAGTFGAASTIVGGAGNLLSNIYGFRNKKGS